MPLSPLTRSFLMLAAAQDAGLIDPSPADDAPDDDAPDDDAPAACPGRASACDPDYPF